VVKFCYKNASHQNLLQTLPDRDRRLSIIFDIDVTVADFVGEAHLIERNLK